MKAYSEDLRERVVRAVDQGRPRAQIVQLFGVSLATLKRYLKHRRETGKLAPKPIPGRLPKKLAQLQADLVTQLAAHDDVRLEDHCRLWEQAHGVDAQKKTLAASERREEDRASFRKQVKPLDAKRLVFVDESGSNIALTPLYARAPRGQRAGGSVPRNRGKNTTLLASLSVQGIGASMILEGATNAAAFEIYLEQILLPSLAPGQIVVMGNLSAHKGARVRQLIEERGCQLLFLPAYSPDFSPIEETFSKIKAYLRRVGARTREALEEAIAQALETVTPQDAHGWFGHCGYSPLHESNA